jgi:hypothetical protein
MTVIDPQKDVIGLRWALAPLIVLEIYVGAVRMMLLRSTCVQESQIMDD